MTRFSAASDVGRANRLAAREPVAVSAETARVVERRSAGPRRAAAASTRRWRGRWTSGT
jgi:hypothetical protein